MLYTAESVTPYHPDKICDQISDIFVDYFIKSDPYSRVAVDCLGGHKKIVVSGEVTSTKKLIDSEILEIIIKEFPHLIDYEISINIVLQSREIAQGVDKGGAGDQGIMVGYACNDNEDMIPQEYYLARSLCEHIWNKFGKTDGKTQITIDEKGNIKAAVASFQNISHDKLLEAVKEKVPNSKEYFINPAGDWSMGGFDADTGVTGRKIAIDNYGPQVPIGGGCFSGKDPTKVDRSAAYMARRIAVDLLKKHKANEVLVKIAYAIGEPEPVMAVATIDGKNILIEGYDLSPQGIINLLNLRTPRYTETARWGSMGKGFSWS
jgi:S-adenosylmethionine synthetase